MSNLTPDLRTSSVRFPKPIIVFTEKNPKDLTDPTEVVWMQIEARGSSASRFSRKIRKERQKQSQLLSYDSILNFEVDDVEIPDDYICSVVTQL